MSLLMSWIQNFQDSCPFCHPNCVFLGSCNPPTKYVTTLKHSNISPSRGSDINPISRVSSSTLSKHILNTLLCTRVTYHTDVTNKHWYDGSRKTVKINTDHHHESQVENNLQLFWKFGKTYVLLQSALGKWERVCLTATAQHHEGQQALEKLCPNCLKINFQKKSYVYFYVSFVVTPF